MTTLKKIEETAIINKILRMFEKTGSEILNDDLSWWVKKYKTE